MPEEKTSVPAGCDRRVALVEADAAMAGALADQLAHFNYALRVAPSLETVAPLLADGCCRALVTDIVLPDGRLAEAGHLAALCPPGGALPPVVFLSARGDFDARLAALRAGGSAYLGKPIDAARLVQCLDGYAAPGEAEASRILIVDDSRSIAAFHAAVLGEAGMEVRVATDPRQVMENLGDFAAELILLDVHMPECSGIELAGILRQQEQFVGIPIVFLSSETSMDRQLLAMGQGGDEFLVKPVDPVRLVATVRTKVLRYREMRGLMLRDGLTGLYNHTTFEQYAERETSRARRQGTPLAFAMIDIDHFKKVNDTWGHPVGDQVIRSLVHLLVQRLRRTDVIGRYGGEEFAVAFPDTPRDKAAAVMETIREAFAQVSQRSGSEEFRVTFSCGIAQWDPDRPQPSVSELADQALYEAKRAGRNRVVVQVP